MSEPGNFRDTQYAFAAHIRDPSANPVPDAIEDRRMAIYRELFFNNVHGFISNGFPVLRSLYDEAGWTALVRDFFARHRCETPYFLEISREFLDYLQSEYRPDESDPPFLFELAHYEWVELALSISTAAANPAGIDLEGDLLEGHPVMSPLAWLLTYRWPVHRIRADYRPGQAPEQPTCLIAYRDDDDDVQFVEINPVTAKLLQRLEADASLSSREVLEEIAAELPQLEPVTVIDGGAAMLDSLRTRGIILGTRA